MNRHDRVLGTFSHNDPQQPLAEIRLRVLLTWAGNQVPAPAGPVEVKVAATSNGARISA